MDEIGSWSGSDDAHSMIACVDSYSSVALSRVLPDSRTSQEMIFSRRVSMICAARRSGLRVRFASGTARLQPRRGLGGILAAVAEAMGSPDWPRLKACRADDCHWAFVDEARNRSRAWCDMKVCGNRQKVHRYRARHAA